MTPPAIPFHPTIAFWRMVIVSDGESSALSPGVAAACAGSLMRGALERLHDVLAHHLGIGEEHHRVVAEEQLVVDAGIARGHAALHEQHGLGLLDVEDRHAVDRAL